MNTILLIILVVGGIWLWWYISHKFKVPKVGSLALVTGGVKSGKSTMSVALVRREYNRRLRRVKFKNFLIKCFCKKGTPLIEEPLIYSNVPLALPYVPLTDDLLMRRERFVYGSVIYCQEASLVADSQLIKDKDINEQLLLFNKLIGHESKGGCLIYDTQAISDVHYSIKRCLSEYFYIHKVTKWIPFFLVLHVQESRYSDDGTIVNGSDEDIELKLRKVIIPKSTWKYFDCYCYSVLTDHLPVNKSVVENNKQTLDLKARNILSFRKNFKEISVAKPKEILKKKEIKNNEKENSKPSI